MTRRPSQDCTENSLLSRRSVLLGGSASLALWGFMPRASAQTTRDPRLLTMILRGGMDGLSLAAPVGDPAYAQHRAEIALQSGGDKPLLALDNAFFGLNPNMPVLKSLFDQREAMIFHAVHTPYRERSHFDGQDVLESGLGGVGRTVDGWLNRALANLPNAGRANPQGLASTDKAKGIALGSTVPLVMRGQAPILSWIPKINDLPLREATVARLMDLYTHTDPTLAKAFAEGFELTKLGGMTGDTIGPQPVRGPQQATMPQPGGIARQPVAGSQPPAAPPDPAVQRQRQFREFTEAAEAAAKFLATSDGPRIGALSYNGWDNHANKGVLQGQFANRLAGLDMAIDTLKTGLGPAWKDTVVVIVTEFGRTVRVNGTSGTDHGMATAALLVGGAVNGGRVVADWPGLAAAQLYENRDLKPTLDLRSVLKGVLRDHIGIPEGALADVVFPASSGARAMNGLIRSA
jgi:uncharacterized protein (DUF1501 family)